MSIKDIARLAGVSPATVSRVLNNPDHRCSSEEVRKRIWRIAREQNYLPNAAARSLKRGDEQRTERISQIDVLMTRSGRQQANPFYNELLRYVESEVHRNHAMLRSIWYDQRFADARVCHKGTAPKMVDGLVRDLVVPGNGGADGGGGAVGGARGSVGAGGVGGSGLTSPEVADDPSRDGLVVIGRCSRDALRAFAEVYGAVVSINRNPCDFTVDEVTCDGERLASKAIDYLAGLGHKHIGYAGQVRDESWFRGYQAALLRHGLSLEVENIFECELSEAVGFDVMNGLIRREGAPSAIFCANDMLALGMIRCMMTRGSQYYRPSIMGCDDIEEGQFCRPMLTTLGVPKRDMARMGVFLLFDRLRGGHRAPIKVELDGKLMVRESCWRHTEDDGPEFII